jgi:hypothetical protein
MKARQWPLRLHSDNNRIQHALYIQFDNVHFRRDVTNVPMRATPSRKR